MDPNLFMETLKIFGQITLQLIQDMPPDQKAAAWQRHADHMAWFQQFWDNAKPKA